MEKLVSVEEISSFLFIQFPELDWKKGSFSNKPAMTLHVDKANDLFLQSIVIEEVNLCVGLTWSGHQQGSACAYREWGDLTIALEQLLKRLMPDINHQQVSIFSFIDDNDR
jgi:hypothetical protein